MVGLLWHWELQDFHNNDVVITTIDLGISYEHHGFNYKEQIHPDWIIFWDLNLKELIKVIKSKQR